MQMRCCIEIGNHPVPPDKLDTAEHAKIREGGREGERERERESERERAREREREMHMHAQTATHSVCI